MALDPKDVNVWLIVLGQLLLAYATYRGQGLTLMIAQLGAAFSALGGYNKFKG